MKEQWDKLRQEMQEGFDTFSCQDNVTSAIKAGVYKNVLATMDELEHGIMRPIIKAPPPNAQYGTPDIETLRKKYFPDVE